MDAASRSSARTELGCIEVQNSSKAMDSTRWSHQAKSRIPAMEIAITGPMVLRIGGKAAEVLGRAAVGSAFGRTPSGVRILGSPLPR